MGAGEGRWEMGDGISIPPLFVCVSYSFDAISVGFLHVIFNVC